MKNLNFLFVLLTLSSPAFAAFNFYGDEDIPVFYDDPEEPMDKKNLNMYCNMGAGKTTPNPSTFDVNNISKCDYGHKPQFFYESWARAKADPNSANLKITDLEPKITSDKGYRLYLGRAAGLEHIKKNKLDEKCRITNPQENKYFLDCPKSKHPVDISKEVATELEDPKLATKLVEAIWEQGRIESQKNNPTFTVTKNSDGSIVTNKKTSKNNSGGTSGGSSDGTSGGSGGGTSGGTSGGSTGGSSGGVSTTAGPETPVTITSSAGGSSGGTSGGSSGGGTSGGSSGGGTSGGSSGGTSGGVKTAGAETENEPEKTEEDPVKDDKECSEALRQAIAALLADDKKNIIGLQYEVTVLKMSALAMGNQTNSLEGLIRKQSKQISEMDNGIIDKMNAMYKAHGLPEDAKTISDNLKLKAKSANYKEKNKRFFNDSSSAFVLAYQQMNKDAGIKDSDVSVLWFMDKVSQRAKSKMGNFSSAHNRTNLSTRISQYTGIVNPKHAHTKDAIEEKLKKQKAKVDKEFLALIEDFKTSNKACYDKLFSDGADECNLSVVDAQFSQLLAINSKIASTDLISLDEHLRGGIDKARFSINMYVDSPDSSKNVKKEEPKKEEPKNEEPQTEEPNRVPANANGVKLDDKPAPKPGEPGYVDPIDQDEVDEPVTETENERLQREEMEQIINHD